MVSNLTDNNQIGTDSKIFVYSKEVAFNQVYQDCNKFDTDDLVKIQGGINQNSATGIKEIPIEIKNIIKGLDFKKLWKNDEVKELLNSFNIPKNICTYTDYVNYMGHLCNILSIVGYSEEKNIHTYISGGI